VTCEAYASEAKYYTDLQSVCSKVEIGSLDELDRRYAENTFDIVAMCEPVNLYENPMELIKKLFHATKKGGMLLFPIRNVSDYKNFLYTLNIPQLRQQDLPRLLYLEDVCQQLSAICAGDIKLFSLNYMEQVAQEMKKEVQTMYEKMMPGENVRELVDRLFVEKYWIVAEK
jgi:hypothetical protein